MPESTAEINARIVASFDALRISVALFDTDDVLIYHNDNYRNTYKCFGAYESLIGLSFTDLLRIKLEHGEIAGRLALDDPAQWIAERLARRQSGSGVSRRRHSPLYRNQPKAAASPTRRIVSR